MELTCKKSLIFKKNDISVKEDIIIFLKDKKYKVLEESKKFDLIFILTENNKRYSMDTVIKRTIKEYYKDYFYTPSELRKIKINKLLKKEDV
jgi:hypothetical protein